MRNFSFGEVLLILVSFVLVLVLVLNLKLWRGAICTPPGYTPRYINGGAPATLRTDLSRRPSATRPAAADSRES